MSPDLENLLAEAYALDQVQRNRGKAISRLQAALSDNDVLAQDAAAERTRLAEVVHVREQGGRHGDHVSAVLYDLLAEAIGSL